MATYELPFNRPDPSGPHLTAFEGMGIGILLHNAVWFTRIRWVVIAVLIAFELLNEFAAAQLTHIGLAPQTTWPWVLAAILTTANVAFVIPLRRLSVDSPRNHITSHIWAQIVVDLLVLTIMVYAVGPFDTFIGFAYLFHIVLACVFFPPRQSLRVPILSAALFLAIIVLELTEVLPHRSIVQNRTVILPPSVTIILSISALFIWFVVWYLVSTISSTVQRVDRELATANENLRRADQEKTLQVLRVTHDLKAPFSGIEGNIQILRFKYWDQLPQDAQRLIERIQIRSLTLLARIRDILLLSNLHSQQAPQQLGPVDLRGVIQQSVESLSDTASGRSVTVAAEIPPVTVQGAEKPLEVLFSNLLANAILYSTEESAVDVTATVEEKMVCVSVRDSGIGIEADALPHIFEEFFRANAASKFNERSTGLGLPIVAAVAQHLGLQIRVTSEEGKGTTFDVILHLVQAPDGDTKRPGSGQNG